MRRFLQRKLFKRIVNLGQKVRSQRRHTGQFRYHFVGGTECYMAPEVFSCRSGQWQQCGPYVVTFSTGCVVVDLLVSGQLYNWHPIVGTLLMLVYRVRDH